VARTFSGAERASLFTLAEGRCSSCGKDLLDGWHADHIKPFSAGGRTEMENGQALCPDCNLEKGSKDGGLRHWQEAALRRWNGSPGRFMLAACPGAGKTRFALKAAERLFDEGAVASVIFVVPSRPLLSQTADTAASVGLRLRPWNNARPSLSSDTDGIVVTYQSVASQPLMFARLAASSLVVLDEAHHIGDQQSWGRAVAEAFRGAPHVLLMTGTPWRSDGAAIPFAEFDADGQLVVDYRYEFADAWADVDRPIRGVTFESLDAEGRWITDRSEWSLRGSEIVTPEEESRVLSSYHDPESEWVSLALDRADRELAAVRANLPNAQGLILARDRLTADKYGAICRRRGLSCEVIHGEEEDAHRRLRRFGRSSTDWLIAVKMVSEGYDNPRLSVLLYAGDARTDLSFHQALGRVLRRLGADDSITAKVLVPHTPTFAGLIKEVDDAHTYQLRAEEAREATPRDSGSEAQERLVLPAVQAEVAEMVAKGLSPTDIAAIVSERIKQLPQDEADRVFEAVLPMLSPPPERVTRPSVLTVDEREGKKRANASVANKVAKHHRIEYSHVWKAVNDYFGQSNRDQRRDDQLDDERAFLERWLRSGSEWGLA